MRQIVIRGDFVVLLEDGIAIAWVSACEATRLTAYCRLTEVGVALMCEAASRPLSFIGTWIPYSISCEEAKVTMGTLDPLPKPMRAICAEALGATVDDCVAEHTIPASSEAIAETIAAFRRRLPERWKA